jgi:hypothetical protein
MVYIFSANLKNLELYLKIFETGFSEIRIYKTVI